MRCAVFSRSCLFRSAAHTLVAVYTGSISSAQTCAHNSERGVNTQQNNLVPFRKLATEQNLLQPLTVFSFIPLRRARALKHHCDGPRVRVLFLFFRALSFSPRSPRQLREISPRTHALHEEGGAHCISRTYTGQGGGNVCVPVNRSRFALPRPLCSSDEARVVVGLGFRFCREETPASSPGCVQSDSLAYCVTRHAMMHVLCDLFAWLTGERERERVVNAIVAKKGRSCSAPLASEYTSGRSRLGHVHQRRAGFRFQ